MSEKHSYSYVIGNEKRGRYLSKNPKHITMVLNNGKNDKFYDYKTEVFEFDEPIVRDINGEIVEYKYDFKVTRI